MLINNATYQRETLSDRPIRQPLILSSSAQGDWKKQNKTKQNKTTQNKTKQPNKQTNKNILFKLVYSSKEA